MKQTEQEREKQQEIARLILVAFVCICGGFLLAMSFGALPLPAITTSHEWIAVAVSAVAAGISGFAGQFTRLLRRPNYEWTRQLHTAKTKRLRILVTFGAFSA